jgi:pyruvate/2-oxoglutarate dehydrogenase complex dihydrolipoamide acyltransferase (E2) component
MSERVFAMPDLGEGLEEGQIVAWLVEEGDTVILNQPLVEVETAKAVVEIPSPFAGRVSALHGAAGEAIAVGAPLATFQMAGDGGGEGSAAPVRSTPAVRKLGKELGVDLAAVSGSGPGGRITERDVRDAAGSQEGLEADEVPVSITRRAIAANLTDTAAIPQVTTFRTVDCTALEAIRSELSLSPLPFLIAALATVFPAHPLINASWHDAVVRTYRHMHVGLAVDSPRGLMVPRLRDADTLGLSGIAAEVGRLAASARDGAVVPQDVSGTATIGVSNTGSYGSEAGTPLLTPGCAVTVAMGAIAPRALVVEGSVEARPACTLSLTFDHRVLDGAAAGRALTDLVDLLQDAARLRNLTR